MRTALVKGERDDDKLDWKKTWLAEMVMTQAEKDRRRGITPEHKRRREIKAGIITASSGVALSVVLSVLMEAIVINGRLDPLAADILSRLWIVGLIPVLVGLALIVNGVFISKRGEDATGLGEPQPTRRLDDASPDYLPAANTNEFIDSRPHSVVDETTKHLKVKR